MIKKMFMITVLLALAAIISLPGYSYAGGASAIAIDNRVVVLETVRQNYLASLRMEALKTKNAIPAKVDASNSILAWLKKVKADEVNMVTNRHTGKKQNEVNMNGKAYFISGESYAWTLQQNPSIRFAKDPLTDKIIDKADAAIFADASGRVLYFESEEAFMALAEKGTTFGYTSPK
ncbi:MAG: hypothetical protein HZB54_00520 [Deltaproteobacteria bacterium]|nr:hypothetical protein [Deltaproteobacteria bacterium]